MIKLFKEAITNIDGIELSDQLQIAMGVHHKLIDQKRLPSEIGQAAALCDRLQGKLKRQWAEKHNLVEASGDRYWGRLLGHRPVRGITAAHDFGLPEMITYRCGAGAVTRPGVSLRG